MRIVWLAIIQIIGGIVQTSMYQTGFEKKKLKESLNFVVLHRMACARNTDMITNIGSKMPGVL